MGNYDPTLPLVPSQKLIMLKTKNLNKLLSQNTSAHVTSAIIFTPSGSLIASSHAPSSPKTLRTQTTLAANIWCAYAATPLPPPSPTASSAPLDHQQPPAPITSLTIELSTSNLHITQIRPRLLLCLIGPATSPGPPQQTQAQPQPPPRPSSDSATSAEGDSETAAAGSGANEPLAVSHNGGEVLSTDSMSRDSSLIAAVQEVEAATHQSGALGILRTQGEGLARWLEGELEGFSMPETM
ncbi:MAG: hypothetical protein M1839_005727 [Geoglossum umbratile]|nr:MAG: hypothetical protein M1839_005727 [Geoglossum umbratile]